MSDHFLSRLREEPRPEFAERLERRLREIDESERERRLAPGPWRRFAPALAGVSLAAALAFAFTLEPVRAAALEFLDLFRVKRFAAVPVDPERLARLAEGGVDFKALVADQVQVVVAPQPPEAVDSPEAGAVAAGITAPRCPPSLPERTELAETKLARRPAFRVQVDTGKLEALALAAGADEIEIPAFWNGATIDVEVPPVLGVRYARTIEATDGRPAREESFVLLQSAIPAGGAARGLRPRDARAARPAPRRHERDRCRELLARDRLALDAARAGAGPGRDLPRGRGVRPPGPVRGLPAAGSRRRLRSVARARRGSCCGRRTTRCWRSRARRQREGIELLEMAQSVR